MKLTSAETSKILSILEGMGNTVDTYNYLIDKANNSSSSKTEAITPDLIKESLLRLTETIVAKEFGGFLPVTIDDIRYLLEQPKNIENNDAYGENEKKYRERVADLKSINFIIEQFGKLMPVMPQVGLAAKSLSVYTGLLQGDAEDRLNEFLNQKDNIASQFESIKLEIANDIKQSMGFEKDSVAKLISGNNNLDQVFLDDKESLKRHHLSEQSDIYNDLAELESKYNSELQLYNDFVNNKDLIAADNTIEVEDQYQKNLESAFQTYQEEKFLKEKSLGELKLRQEQERKELELTQAKSIGVFNKTGFTFSITQNGMQNDLTATLNKVNELNDAMLQGFNDPEVLDKLKWYNTFSGNEPKDIDRKAGELTEFEFEDKARASGNTDMFRYDSEGHAQVTPLWDNKNYSQKNNQSSETPSKSSDYHSVREYFENKNLQVVWSKKDGVTIDGRKIDTSKLKLVNGRYMATESELRYITHKYDLLSAANGAVIDRNQLAMLHGSKNSPEFVINSPQMKKLMNQVVDDFNIETLKRYEQNSPNLTVQFNVDKVDANNVEDIKNLVDIFTTETLKQLKMGGVNIK